MPYIATKSRTVCGVPYARGDVVDTSALSVEKLARLVRVGLLVPGDSSDVQVSGRRVDQTIFGPPTETETEAVPAAAAPDPAPDGDVCPDCGGGPYRNLRLHYSKVHEYDEMTNEEQEPDNGS